MRREAGLTGNAVVQRDAKAMELTERRLWRQFDTVMYPSEEEAATVRAMEPRANVQAIVPYCFDRFRERAAASGGSVILFVAGFAHLPNADAAEFLVTQVLSMVHAAVPEVKLVLAGSHPSAAVQRLAGPAVEVTGWVSEARLAQYYQEARVAVVPLRFGAGVKGKVVEALREGLPLVTTAIGAQGIPGLGDIVPVCDSPADMAGALVRLLLDDAAWVAQSRGQVRFAEERFSRAAMRTSFLAALEEAPAVVEVAGAA
jgi:glycosyltransferase involved in cell wall biosynthesis